MHSILYATRDVVLAPPEGIEYYVSVIHVSDETLSRKGIEQITQLAAQYLGTDTSPLYVLHVFPNQNRLDLSFGATEDDNLTRLVEQQGVAPLLQATAASFQARTSDNVLTCNCANLAFESQSALEDGVHDVALGNAVHVDFQFPVHAPLKAFLSMCQSA